MPTGIPLPDLIAKMQSSGIIVASEHIDHAFESVDRMLRRIFWCKNYIAPGCISLGSTIFLAIFLWWFLTNVSKDILLLGWVKSLLAASSILFAVGFVSIAIPQLLIFMKYHPKCFQNPALQPYHDLLKKFNTSEITVFQHGDKPVDAITFSSPWALVLFSKYKKHRSIWLPSANRMYNSSLTADINQQQPIVQNTQLIVNTTTYISNVNSIQNNSTITNNKSVMQVMLPPTTQPVDPIPKTVGGEIIWHLYSIWNLSPSDVGKIFDDVQIYPESNVKALRAKLTAQAVAARVGVLRDIELRRIQGEEGLETEYSRLKKRSMMKKHIQSVLKMFEHELSRNEMLDEIDAREFASLNQKETGTRNSKLEQLICGSYPPVNRAIEQRAIELGLISTRYLGNKPAI